MHLDRRHFLKNLGLGSLSLGLVPASWAADLSAPGRSFGLPRSIPAAQGVAAEGLLNFLNAVETADLNLHSLMVLRHGQVVAEGWWAPYAPDLKHTLYSLSKSFTSTAVGLAVAEGRLTVDDKITSFFNDELPQTVSENLAAMRVRDLLTMSTGHDKDTTATMRADSTTNWVRTFLAQPVDHKPGTHFVYNSGATYMLSALVQKLTGQTLLTYLTPRLFGPLGIDGADWEVSPAGVNTGGWGLRVKTEDIAKFGQLYLQKGIWKGKRILPEAWIADATKAQVMSAGGKRKAEENDWLQGYGYQFWRCRHDAYRGDGAFGQYCIVMPDADAVVAITSETGDMQAILDAVWDHILPAMRGAGTSAAGPLKQKLSQLALPFPKQNATSPTAATISGRPFTFADNSLKADTLSLTFDKDRCVVNLRDGQGTHRIVCGLNRWLESESTLSVMPLKLVATPVPGESRTRIAATGTWTAPRTFLMTWRFIETAHYETVTCQFGPDSVTVAFESSLSKLNKTKDPRPVLQGTLRSEAALKKS